MSTTPEQKRAMLQRTIAELNDTSVDCLLATYELQIMDQEAELAALRKDRERLDWLEKNKVSCICSKESWDCEIDWWWTVKTSRTNLFLRAAIDAARSGEKGAL